MSKYYIKAVIVMEEVTVEFEKINHIENLNGEFIHESIFNTDYKDIEKVYPNEEFDLFVNDLDNFIKNWMVKKLKMDDTKDAKFFNFIFVNADTDEYSHYIQFMSSTNESEYEEEIRTLNTGIFEKGYQKEKEEEYYKCAKECIKKMNHNF